MMNGHVIKNTGIAVDYWTTGKFVYFLTHCHADHMAKLTHHWWHPIYTSHCNVRWLEEVIKVSKHFLRPLNINEEVIIENPYSKDKFTVTLIDARHCPGAVMFYFQGSFGNILYTGDFRYDEQMHTDLILQSIIRKQDVNVLYLDNTYASPTCVFPSREEAMEEILDIIIKHPNSHIYLGLRLLGKEEILWSIYKKLKEKVYVNEKRMRFLNTLGLQTEMCTSRQNESRISVLHFNTLTSAWIEDRRREGMDCIGIKPTALFMCLNFRNGNSGSSGLYVVPYSDHCSSKELSSFVSDLKPEQLYPIINYTKHLGSECNNKRICKIPAFFYDFCRKGNVNCRELICEKYQHCRCNQPALLINNESIPQNYSNKSKYRTFKIPNTRSEKTGHNLGFHSEIRITDHKGPTNLQHHSQPSNVDFKKCISTSEVEVINNIGLLKGEKEKLTKSGNNKLQQDFISQKNYTRNNAQFTQCNVNALSHNLTSLSQPLNTVQNCLSNAKKKPVINSKFTCCKVSERKVDANRIESCKRHRFSLLYSEDAEEISIEHKHNGDRSKLNPYFKTNKRNYVVDCNTRPLKDETENIMQNLRPHSMSKNSFLDSYIGSHEIKFNAQRKARFRDTGSNPTINISEPLKKRIKISKKLDL